MSGKGTSKERRRFYRGSFSGKLIAHDNKKVIHGSCFDIGVMGLSFYTRDELWPVGTQLVIHVKPGHGLSAFNALCEVVSRKGLIASGKSPRAAIKYGVKFLRIPRQIQEEIHEYAKKRVPKVAA